MDIGPGDRIELAGQSYLVQRDAVERGFSYDDVKFWVKKCLLEANGEPRILKLVFHESFKLKIAGFDVRCYRSPSKEARILKLVQGDARFMQGQTVLDAAGNPVRIIEVVRGMRLDALAAQNTLPHPAYFREVLPGLLRHFLEACEAIAHLHANREIHGDICGDHLLLEHQSGRCRWIDFDYAFENTENPFGLDVYGLGDLLLFLCGRGHHSLQSLREKGWPDALLGGLSPDDYCLLYPNRLANLGKIYPYLPGQLNQVLMHFSAQSDVCYESVAEFLDELRPCLAGWF